MKKISQVALIAFTMLSSSCFNNGDDRNPYIPYVGTLLNDTSTVGYHVLNAHDAHDKYRSISILGDPVDILPIVNELLTADRFNNIDGRKRPDGLPDFSGETIEALLDETNAPYGGYLQRGNEFFLREIQVRNFISALDTNYLYSPYDRNQFENRSGAKLVVLGSSEAYLYGKHDIDTLCQLAQVDVPVYSSLECVFDYIAARKKTDQQFCVWTSSEKANRQIHAASYEKYLKEHGITAGQEPLIYSPDVYLPLETRFKDILDMYLQSSQNDEMISFMLVDDPYVDMPRLEQYVEELKKGTEEAELAYRNVLSDDFEFIWPAKAVVETVFHHLRENNQFTHKIAYPGFKGYITLPVNDLPVISYTDDGSYSDEYKYLRADGTDEESWYVIAMRKRYISDGLQGKISQLAPKIDE